ncbi:sugar ABC transporter ATP-binding protein [Candidatus Aerophobetes bacterium]|nr:sugar ABC transporter ATP-binding protein [Candidatus Aerophobetes bacterium]
MCINNLCWNNRLFNVTFKLYQGEILGIYGLTGSGRTELAKVIFGRFPYERGEIILDGRKNIKIRCPRDAINYGIAYVPEDRRGEGIISELSVGENISLISLNYTRRNSFSLINKKEEKRQVAELVKGLSIKTPSFKQKVKFLSGGNQQKVVLAKWLNRLNAQVIIFDEPTRGIDVGAKAQIYKIIDELVRKGKSIVLISSELPEILGLSDRILVMAGGKIVGEFSGDVSEEEILTCALKQREKI